jgi:hypothetical protein
VTDPSLAWDELFTNLRATTRMVYLLTVVSNVFDIRKELTHLL